MEIITCTFDKKEYPKIDLEFMLAETCVEIFENYTKYDYREKLVLKALSLAKDLGITSGFRHDDEQVHYPVVVIQLPFGEVSFHMPPVSIPFDGSKQEDQKLRADKYKEQILKNKEELKTYELTRKKNKSSHSGINWDE